eukprot:scaffold82425_cov42-Phaeocystis_antarctica.AAC.1
MASAKATVGIRSGGRGERSIVARAPHPPAAAQRSEHALQGARGSSWRLGRSTQLTARLQPRG